MYRVSCMCVCVCNGIYAGRRPGPFVSGEGFAGRPGRRGGARVTTEIHLSRRITKTVGIYLACRVGVKTDG